MPAPKKVTERFATKLRSFLPVLEQQKARDVSEADTVTIVKDLLSEVFGYDKYAELTSEHNIRSTYCDLAIKLNEKLAFLIEVKAIGLDLKDNHVRQAIDYAANQGCEYVLLTNGIDWRLYHVTFKKPIDKQEIANFNLLAVDLRDDADVEKLFLVSKEGFVRSALREYRDRKDATNRYMVAAIILHCDAVQSAIRREIRRVSEIMVPQEDVEKILREEVLKRETIEGEHANAAVRRVSKRSERSILKANERDVSPAKPVTPTEPLG